MKKFILFLSAVFLLAVSVQAQVAINHDHSQADASAVLDVKSTIRGVLFPRMTRAQMSDLANNSLPDGLMVFNTDDGKLYIYVSSAAAWKEVNYESGAISGPATYTIGTGGSCSNTTVNGYYAAGSVLDGSNTVTLDASVTVTGTWSITTNTVNGYSFSGSGTFTVTGTQQVTLNASGTPSASQTDTFTATANNNGGTCTFDVTVMGTVTSQGRIWMDRNLGASQVADSLSDANAYGGLYQWGRATEGHENRNSSTSSTLATTAVPNGGNTWDGKFITNSNSPYDWLSTQNDNLWQGVTGTNNPCPAGFRLPTQTEWQTEYNSWLSQDESGAYASPLKLSDAGWRSGDGTLVNVGTEGDYWSSSVDNTLTKIIYFDNDGIYEYSARRVDGMSVRCIKD